MNNMSTNINIPRHISPWIGKPVPVNIGANYEFELHDRRDGYDVCIIHGKYSKLKSNTITINTGFGINNMGEMLTNYFAYRAFVGLPDNNDRIYALASQDVNVRISITDHKAHNSLKLTAIRIISSTGYLNRFDVHNIIIATKQGYDLWLQDDKKLMKVCEQDKLT